MTEWILVGDIGGTSARFAAAQRMSDGALNLQAFAKQNNDDFKSAAEAIAYYLSTVNLPIDAGLLAVAGPIDPDGSAKLTNRNWPVIVPADLCKMLNLSNMTLLNDFAVMSRAVPEMQADAFVEILPGKSVESQPILVTGPGTGFGMGTLISLGNDAYHVLTGEGGHSAYSANTAREAELAERLRAKHGYVSTEMVVGGAWLSTIFNEISEMHGARKRDLSPTEIMNKAASGDPVCSEVCEIRAQSIMGAVGDGVLMTGARGGVVLTGGVAERMVAWLQKPASVQRFLNRGSHSQYMQDISVRVMVEPRASLIGAAAIMFDGKLQS